MYFHDMFKYFMRPVPGNYEFVVIKSWILKEEEKRKKEILTRTTSVAAALCNAIVQINNKVMDNIIEAIVKFFWILYFCLTMGKLYGKSLKF